MLLITWKCWKWKGWTDDEGKVRSISVYVNCPGGSLISSRFATNITEVKFYYQSSISISSWLLVASPMSCTQCYLLISSINWPTAKCKAQVWRLSRSTYTHTACPVSSQTQQYCIYIASLSPALWFLSPHQTLIYIKYTETFSEIGTVLLNVVETAQQVQKVTRRAWLTAARSLTY